MQEYVCNDGRMSVNGICAIDQKDGSETSSNNFEGSCADILTGVSPLFIAERLC